MNYSLTDYQGNELTIAEDKAAKVAQVSGLIEIEVAGKTYYLNPKNIASIMPARVQGEGVISKERQIGAPEPIMGDGYDSYKKKRDELFGKDV